MSDFLQVYCTGGKTSCMLIIKTVVVQSNENFCLSHVFSTIGLSTPKVLLSFSQYVLCRD